MEAVLHSKRERSDALKFDKDICDGMFQTEHDPIGSYDKLNIYNTEKVAASLR